MQSKTGETCSLDVLRAEEASYDRHTSADVLPKNVVVSGGESRTFALTFLRPISPDERSGSLLARAQMQLTSASGAQQIDEVELQGAALRAGSRAGARGGASRTAASRRSRRARVSSGRKRHRTP
ncbi:MAG: hypothetical protein R3F14_22900 [Polyangiaceae bacterium]